MPLLSPEIARCIYAVVLLLSTILLYVEVEASEVPPWKSFPVWMNGLNMFTGSLGIASTYFTHDAEDTVEKPTKVEEVLERE